MAYHSHRGLLSVIYFYLPFIRAVQLAAKRCELVAKRRVIKCEGADRACVFLPAAPGIIVTVNYCRIPRAPRGKKYIKEILIQTILFKMH